MSATNSNNLRERETLIHKNELLCNNSNNGHIHIWLLLIEFIAKKAWKALEEALEWQNQKSIIKGNFHMANCLDVILVLMQKALFAFDAFTRSTFWSGVKGSNNVYSSTKTKWKKAQALKLCEILIVWASSICPFFSSFFLWVLFVLLIVDNFFLLFFPKWKCTVYFFFLLLLFLLWKSHLAYYNGGKKKKSWKRNPIPFSFFSVFLLFF